MPESVFSPVRLLPTLNAGRDGCDVRAADAPTTGSKTIAVHLASTECPFSEASFETFDRQLPGGLLPWRLVE